ncbi:MAG: DEAD/DEAH box helicase family protein [Pseudomonadota bacterium]
MITEFKEVDELSPSDFELFVKDVFLAAGWSDAYVTEVGKEYRHGDGGVDIFAYKNKRKFAIEVKQRNISTTVDVKALNQLVTGARLANARNMILVTNSYFTSEVKIRALRLGVELIDRDELQNLWVKKQSEIGREIKPRQYQVNIIDECLGMYVEGKSKILIEMATGLGKTYTAALLIKNIVQNATKRMKVLFVAHQVEILLQSVTSFKNVLGVGNYTFSACFSGSEPEDTDFVFASFDTLYGKISSLNQNEYDLVVIDEAHHTPARTYSQVVTNFSPKLLIGLTATPYREDNSDVLKYFGGPESHVGKYDLAWALRHNKLAFPRYMVMLDDLNQDRINQLKSGLSISDLDKRLFLHKKDEEVVRLIEKTVEEKKILNPKGIVFCRSIEHMKYLIQFFGLGKATMVHSKMKDQERRDNVRMFRESEFSYILVCDLFNEGIDIPETNILIFMRYTGSRTIWLQQLGRGLRKTPNKEYVHVLDFVGSLERLNEVRELQSKINKTKIERGSWEPRRREEDGGEEGGGQIMHDSTLDVTYNQSAAQVLKLIDELKYRLNTREGMIDSLRVYFDSMSNVPNISEIEDVLEDVTCDQVSTHFDSYHRYLKAAIPGAIDYGALKTRLKLYVSEYQSTNSAIPSLKAISVGFKYKSLVEFVESDIEDLIGNTYEERVANSNESKGEVDELHRSESSGAMCGSKDSDNNKGLSCEQVALLSRYAGVVSVANDILELSSDERMEIKKLFKSEFYFVKLISEVGT